jgi:hypothetical protein
MKLYKQVNAKSLETPIQSELPPKKEMPARRRAGISYNYQRGIS